ncbi:hypothetical protein C8F01DRAFT_1129685 [Mycena amicta]|nr:hypothetical protein C8F01DRAFT_1129685 [Mycena amicta]
MVETEDEAAIGHDIYISRLLILIPFTILLYEYLLTLSREVAGFWAWRRRPTWGTAFFFINRYSPLVGNIPILVQYFSTTTDPSKLHICHALRAYHQYFALLSQVLVAVMLIMRTYALYERNRRILAFTILITLAAFIFAVYILLSSGADPKNMLSPELAAFGCPVATAKARSLRLGEAWSSMLVFDVTIFALTLYKALRLHAHGAGARGGGLIEILLRDGSVYFALMVISNACNIATYTMAGPFLRGSATTVTNVTSSIMISRLMLNLRAPTSTSTFSPRPTHVHGRTQSTSRLTRTGADTGGPALTTVAPYYTQNGDGDEDDYGGRVDGEGDRYENQYEMDSRDGMSAKKIGRTAKDQDRAGV